MNHQKLLIAEYDPEWPTYFNTIKSQLLTALANNRNDFISIEHVGSTAVPGLCAKPTIDIDIVACSKQQIMPIVNAITTSLPYVYLGEFGITDRHALKFTPTTRESGSIDAVDRHLYICAEGSVPLRNHLGLRQVLRENEEIRLEYACVKRELAETCEDTMIYSARKTGIIQKILTLAGTLTDEERKQIELDNKVMEEKVREAWKVRDVEISGSS
ncbi:hypothetical protein BT63DRAFT_457568 [Microthyrium microscopicum]|uniref:Uncharacterized protein n=1 Tax=Microthyrium microscopicum TaxID=703497 RepID=A0A6A6U5A7_9PEZI|nr:hypothetical protein BT63DRAFT_457568 [Microthyrium microscopicum]